MRGSRGRGSRGLRQHVAIEETRQGHRSNANAALLEEVAPGDLQQVVVAARSFHLYSLVWVSSMHNNTLLTMVHAASSPSVAPETVASETVAPAATSLAARGSFR